MPLSLQEAGALLKNEELTAIGKRPHWWATSGATLLAAWPRVKARVVDNSPYNELGDMLPRIADEEEKIFRRFIKSEVMTSIAVKDLRQNLRRSVNAQPGGTEFLIPRREDRRFAGPQRCR